MIARPFAAFGYVTFFATLRDGEQLAVNITSDSGTYTNGFYYYYRGLAKFRVVETGVDLPDRAVGWLNKEHDNAGTDRPGTIIITAVGNTAWVCIPLTHNKSLPDTVVSDSITEHSAGTFLKESNILLVTGKLSVAGKVFNAPAQIRIRTADVEYTALEESQILRFL